MVVIYYVGMISHQGLIRIFPKIINESMPRNDIFWRFSKERTEWNKIYKSFIVDRSFIVERKREEI
nr:hypothetical protein [Proteus mirabilis]